MVVMSGLGLAVLTGREAIAAAYTDDPVIAARAMTLFVFAAFVFVPDSAQVVMGQALRAMGDAWFAVACYIVSFVVLMVPLGWVLVNPLGYDERALICAVIAACVLATVLLSLRFHWLTRAGGRREAGGRLKT
jgi:Na+-driven multidrug efflux pump